VIARTSSLQTDLGVIATALSISAAPSIDSVTIRIVRLIIVLPGLSHLSTMRKLSPAELLTTRTSRTRNACSMHEIGVLPPRHRQTKEASLRHDESIVTNARILTLAGVED
jgi:hypothetical protein